MERSGRSLKEEREDRAFKTLVMAAGSEGYVAA